MDRVPVLRPRVLTVILTVVTFALIAISGLTPASNAQDTPKGWFGADVHTYAPHLAQKYNLELPVGVVIDKVEPGGPAAAAGLKPGDQIIKVEDQATNDKDSFDHFIAEHGPGSVVDVVVYVDGSPQTKQIKLVAQPVPVDPGVVPPPKIQTQLLLNTGGHMGSINGLIFTPDGKYLVSAGSDKVIRIWDWRKGETRRLIVGESGKDSAGQIYVMAMSPDAKIIAVGGYFEGDQNEIRLFDFESGKLLHLLEGHGDVVHGLAFSPDGKKLASSSGDSGVFVWDVDLSTGNKPTLLYKFEDHTSEVYAVTFSKDGKAVLSAGFDTTLRAWPLPDDASSGESPHGKEVGTHPDKVFSIAVSPTDGTVATGTVNGEIRLWDGKTYELKGIMNIPDGAVISLKFSLDGKMLIATNGQGVDVTVWDVANRKLIHTYGNHDNIVNSTALHPDGKLIATGGGDRKEIHIWEIATGKRELGEDGQPIDLMGTGKAGWAVSFSNDGHWIAWGGTYDHSVKGRLGPLEYQLKIPAENETLSAPILIPTAKELSKHNDSLDNVPSQDQYVQNITTTPDGRYSMKHRRGGPYGRPEALLDIFDGDKLVATIGRGGTDGYRHRVYTFSPDGKTIISGAAGGVLQAFDLKKVIEVASTQDKLLIWGEILKDVAKDFIGHSGDVWTVAVSPDSRLLVSGNADQTIRLWNMKTHKLIVTLFHGDDHEWAMWTEQGYYHSSPKGGELVGWQINQGRENAARYVYGQQLRKKLQRPRIILRALQLRSARRAIQEAKLQNVTIEAVLTTPPPEINVRAMTKNVMGGGGIIEVAGRKSDLENAEIRITVSKEGEADRNVKTRLVTPPPGTPTPEGNVVRRYYDVHLYKGDNTVRVVAINEGGESQPASVTITHNGDGTLDKRGTLWLLAVGVDKYPKAHVAYNDLKYASADALLFAQTISGKMKDGHEHVKVTVLVNGGGDGEPTRDNITKALENIANNATDNDTVIVFLAGHGENWKAEQGDSYHFLPTDFERTSKTEKGQNLIDWSETIQATINKTTGRRLVFVDACQAGSTQYHQTLLSDAQADGFVAFSATGPNQDAEEFSEEGHGAFTYMLVEGLKGEARDRAQRGVTVYRLGTYVNEKVSIRTRGRQTPLFQSGAGNFVLSR